MLFEKELSQTFCLMTCLFLFASLLGCSGQKQELPELGEVTGKVTLDGKPLAEAVVDFYPQAAQNKSQARTSTAATDENGIYKLMYNNDTAGAILGEHIVRITKNEGGAEVAGPEMIPAKYNEKSTLKANVVKEGPNKFDFDLKSK